MNGIVTLDIGTTSIRATLYDETGLPAPPIQRDNPPRYFPDGRVEQEAEVWDRVIPALLRDAAALAESRAVTVVGLALTSQRSSVIPVDREGRALRPAIMWQDLRTAPIVAEFASRQRSIHARSGLAVTTVFSAVKMLWLKRNEPEVYARAHKLVGIHDYALRLLTGRFVTDHSLASRTNLLGLEARTWDPELAGMFGIEVDKLCELAAPGSVVGGLRDEMAARVGLAAGLPVVSAGGDQQCAALGLGLFSSERAVVNTGTASYLLGHAASPRIDPEMRLFCNAAALPGAYIVEASLPSSGSTYRWLSELLNEGSRCGEEDFAALAEEARRSGPGARGVVLIPHFNGSGSPDWDSAARGSFHNLSLSTSRGDLARAVMEGIALELRGFLDLVESFCGRTAELSLSGGLCRSDLFGQIQADALGRPAVFRGAGEATSLGAWISGSVATGLAPGYSEAFARATEGQEARRHEPEPAAAAFYEGRREGLRALAAALSSPEARRFLADAK